MKRIVIATAMSLCLVSLAALASADTLTMRDGTRVEGTLVGITGRTITFRHANGVSRRYATSDVRTLDFISAERANPRATDSGRLEAPAGTEMVVRTVETIDSRNAGPDQVFSAIVEQPVVNASGRVVIPAGASAQLVIRDLSPGGATGRRDTSTPDMVLDLQSITIEGRRYLVSTVDLNVDRHAGTGMQTRTAGAVGGAPVLGTSTGGADAPVLTRGRDVRVPSASVLTFRLDRPVILQPER